LISAENIIGKITLFLAAVWFVISAAFWLYLHRQE